MKQAIRVRVNGSVQREVYAYCGNLVIHRFIGYNPSNRAIDLAVDRTVEDMKRAMRYRGRMVKAYLYGRDVPEWVYVPCS